MAKPRVRNSIRRLRFDAGEMTQRELASRVECTRQTIVMLEQERYVPSLALAFRIARVFSKSIEDVFRYEDEDEDEA